MGKTYWISPTLSGVEIIDLLKTDVLAEYITRPALLRERCQNHKGLIVIDEIQKVPSLLDEVHWLIENRQLAIDQKQLTRNGLLLILFITLIDSIDKYSNPVQWLFLRRIHHEVSTFR